jgi:hypothetical protein
MAASPLGIEFWSSVWDTYKANREHIVPLLTFVGAGIVAWAALKQARTATRVAKTAAEQAEIARLRHEEQTKADLQRRITESFTKAVEQLSSDKLQIRLGGIYTLERISRESELDYWPIMETLTAFVRERARWKEEQVRWKSKDTTPSKPSTDIAAVLTVIRRRDSKSRERERSENWKLDFTSADLRGAILSGAHLEGAILVGAHLEEAVLYEAHLEGAFLAEAHLEEPSEPSSWTHIWKEPISGERGVSHKTGSIRPMAMRKPNSPRD